MKPKKIGLLALALVLALGTLGVGYAAWTDTITIDGSVNTGTLDLNVVEYSGLWMWKIPGGDPEYYLTSDPDFTPDQVGQNDPPFVVAFSKAEQTLDAAALVDDAVTVTFDNLFPISDGVPVDGGVWTAYCWKADFIVHYEGSVPAMVDAECISVTADPMLEWMWANNYITVEFYELTDGYAEGGPYWPYIDGEITEAVQMHNCDYVVCLVYVCLPQVPPAEFTQEDFMNLSGSFTAEITAIQWNEYTP